MVTDILSNDQTQQLKAIIQCRSLLAMENDPPIQQVIDAAGVVPRFIEFMKRANNHRLQFEATWALTNIAAGTSDHTRVVVDHGAVPVCVQLLSSPDANVREQAVWALGNIAGDSPQCRDAVLRANALPPLLSLLHNNQTLSMLRHGTWTLSNFCRGTPRPQFQTVRPALPILKQLLFQLDDDVLTDACWALSYLTDGPNENIAAVVESGATMRLVELLGHPRSAVHYPAVVTIGNIVSGNNTQTQCVVDCSALPSLMPLLSSTKKNIQKTACWAVSNIAAGSATQIQAVFETNGLVPKILDLLEHGKNDQIKKEAVFALTNITSGGTTEQIERLCYKYTCIGPLVNALGVQDPAIVEVLMEGLNNILKKITRNTQGVKTQNTFAPVLLKLFRQWNAVGGTNKIHALQQRKGMSEYFQTQQIQWIVSHGCLLPFWHLLNNKKLSISAWGRVCLLCLASTQVY
jgi:hypothetical protein